MISGQKLRQFRAEVGDVRPVALAAAMGVERQRIGQIEQSGEVGREVAERYLTGLLTAAGIIEPGDTIEIRVHVFANGEEVAEWTEL